jgi:mannose-6-phosphate isomerase-like protein (cupin superfamily)
LQNENLLVETVTSSIDSEVLAVILAKGRGEDGIHFVTEHSTPQQLALLRWPRGHKILAHVHNPLSRTINSTQEVLFIRSGRVRVDLYRSDLTYECSRELQEGDVMLLVSGGHGFEILEDADIVEVKQGPYLGEKEKTRFAPRDNPHWKD